MSLSLVLTISALICLCIAALRAQRHLRERKGLRLIFIGLFAAGISGVAISALLPSPGARFVALPMLAGMGLVVWGIRASQQPVRDGRRES
jgi:hypothetical protein